VLKEAGQREMFMYTATERVAAEEESIVEKLPLRAVKRIVVNSVFEILHMVKELSPLVLYLYYLAKRGDWLIIDEPEMNLHPEAQARLTEFLAMLVQAGIHVLVTTHSPFIVDHLANLMKAAEHTDPEERESIRQEFFLQRTEAFIPKADVSVYLVDNGTATNILGEDGLIHWDTFSDVSDKVTQIYFTTHASRPVEVSRLPPGQARGPIHLT